MIAKRLKRNMSSNNMSLIEIRPPYKSRVSVQMMKELMKNILDKTFSSTNGFMRLNDEELAKLNQLITEQIRKKLKALNYPRYKFIVQVVLGEQRGGGVRSGTKVFWDGETDKHASESFVNEHIFCIASVYAVYLY